MSINFLKKAGFMFIFFKKSGLHEENQAAKQVLRNTRPISGYSV